MRHDRDLPDTEHVGDSRVEDLRVPRLDLDRGTAAPGRTVNGDTGFLGAFDMNRDVICEAALNAYGRTKRGDYDLIPADF